jgi:non-ribosomal peptide synthetase component F
VLFGAVVSGRPEGLAGVETMVGPFINTLPVRVTIEDEQLVLEWLRQLQAQQIELLQYEHSPLVDVQGWSEIPRGVPLFDSFLNFLNYPKLDAKGEWGGALRVSDFRTSERSSYALTVDASMGAELILEITADSQHFEAPAVKRLLEDWGEILRALVAHPEITLAALLSKVDETERGRQDREDEEQREKQQRGLKEIRRRAVTATE